MSKFINSVVKFFAHNSWPKFISFFLAVFLWIIVNAGVQRASTFPGGIPIQLDNKPTGLVAILDNTEVKITLVAERALWQRFTANSFRASIDLEETKPGVIDKQIIVSSRIPGVQITKIEPERVLVRLEPLENKTVPVNIKIDGQAADGFVPSDIILLPTQITASGPNSELDQLERVTANLILGGDEKESFSRKVTLRAAVAGRDLESTTLNPAEITAQVSIVRATDIKNLGVLLKTSGALSSGFAIKKLNLIPSVITVSGDPKILANLPNLSTRDISLSTIDQNTEIAIPIVVPEGVKLVNPENKHVSVTIELEPIFTVKTATVGVNLSGLRSGLKTKKIDPSLVKVELKGPVDVINNLNLAELKFDLTASADLIAGQPRIFKLTAEQIKLASQITVQKIEPDKVVIEVEAE